MLASFMSAIMLLGTPAEIFTYGTEYMMIGVAYCLVMPAAAYLYLPIFYKLHLTSAYEVSFMSENHRNIILSEKKSPLDNYGVYLFLHGTILIIAIALINNHPRLVFINLPYFSIWS